MKKILILITFIILFGLTNPAWSADNKISVRIFTQTSCAYCATTMAHLNQLKKEKYPNLEITEYDIRRDPSYYQLFNDYRRAYGSDADGTPVTFIGNKVIQGELLAQIDTAIEECTLQNCEDPANVVAKFIKENPSSEQKQAQDKKIIGWIVIGVVLTGGGILLLSKN
jgi:glutaredoxin